MDLPREITSHPDYHKGEPVNVLKLLDDNFKEVEVKVLEFFNGWAIYKGDRCVRSFYLDVKEF